MIRYEIKAKSNSVAKDWYALEKNLPEAMERCKNFLQESPLDRLKSGGRLKKLQGKLKGILQYDITDSYRVQYTVDSNDHVVYIEYIGGHP